MCVIWFFFVEYFIFFIHFNQCRCTERDAGFAAGWSFWNSRGSSQKLQESSAQLPPPLEVFLWPTRVSDYPSGQWGHQASHWLLQVHNTLESVMICAESVAFVSVLLLPLERPWFSLLTVTIQATHSWQWGVKNMGMVVTLSTWKVLMYPFKIHQRYSRCPPFICWRKWSEERLHYYTDGRQCVCCCPVSTYTTCLP